MFPMLLRFAALVGILSSPIVAALQADDRAAAEARGTDLGRAIEILAGPPSAERYRAEEVVLSAPLPELLAEAGRVPLERRLALECFVVLNSADRLGDSRNFANTSVAEDVTEPPAMPGVVLRRRLPTEARLAPLLLASRDGAVFRVSPRNSTHFLRRPHTRAEAEAWIRSMHPVLSAEKARRAVALSNEFAPEAPPDDAPRGEYVDGIEWNAGPEGASLRATICADDGRVATIEIVGVAFDDSGCVSVERSVLSRGPSPAPSTVLRPGEDAAESRRVAAGSLAPARERHAEFRRRLFDLLYD